MPRVAVIVVPGVGDDAPGETLDAVAGHLVSRSDLQDGERGDLLVSPAGDEVSYRAAWTRLRSSDPGGLQVDVYEMRWADISRFPGGMLRFVYTLYALLLQISTVGLEALRVPCGPGGSRRALFARGSLNVFSWILAVLVMAVTFGVMLETAALLAAVALQDHEVFAATVVAAIGLLLLGAAAWGGRRLAAGGWRHAPVALGVLAVAAVADTAWSISQSGLRVGVANALIVFVSTAFRLAWLAAALAAGAAGIALVLMVFRRTAGLVRLDGVSARAALTGVLTLVIAPLGVAVVSAMLFAGVGALALQFTTDDGWGSTPAQLSDLLCLSGPNAVVPEACGLPTAPPNDWAFNLFGSALSPLVPTLIIVAILIALVVLIVVLPFLIAIVTSRFEGRRDVRGASERQGELMSSAVQAIGSPMAGLIGIAALLAAAAGVVVSWIVLGAEPGSRGAAELGAAVAVVTGGLLVTVRLLGITPSRALGQASGPLERVRIVLDIPYDIATYLRVSQPGLVVAPRRRMLRRYRALLREVAAGGVDRVPYDGLVITAHSQGTVLSAATLFGDAFRSPPAEPLDRAEPAIALPPRVSLVTFGSPLRQLYGERFPGQYDWVRARLDAPEGFAPLTDHWVNLYRSGDYVGRTLWAPDPDAPEVWDPDRVAFETTVPGGVRVLERCVGPGSHTGYWSSPMIGDWVMHLVLRAAGAPAAPEPAR